MSLSTMTPQPVDLLPRTRLHTAIEIDSGDSPLPAMLPTFGEYQNLELAGQGGMGVVYKAWHGRLNRLEALKVIRSGELASPRELARFQFEAESAAGLDHPNIVPVYGAGEIEGRQFLAMKWIDGGDLAAQLPNYRTRPREGAKLIAKIARALHYAHQRGILHRDLKPENILVDRQGKPHITDFGLAKRLDSPSTVTQTHMVLGTPSYMAPEQARGERNLTVAVDVYAIGAVLYSLLTGRPPFQGSKPVDVMYAVVNTQPVTPRAINPDVDSDLQAICLKCLEKDPRERYHSADDLADDLTRYLDGKNIVAQAPGIWDWFRQMMRTRPLPSPDYSWQVLIWFGIIFLAMNATIFGLVRANEPSVWVWPVHIAAGVAISVVIWVYLARRFRRLPGTERHSVMIAVGHLLAQVALAFAFLPLAGDAPIRSGLGLYPALAGISGMGLFIIGSTQWSRFYLLGLGVIALAPVMAHWPDESPLIYGSAIALCMWYWAYSLGVTFGGAPQALAQDPHSPAVILEAPKIDSPPPVVNMNAKTVPIR